MSDLAMPYAECWKRLLDLEIQKILDLEAGKSRISIFNLPIAANTNMIGATRLTPLQTPCIFRIYIALSNSGVFSVQRLLSSTGITVTEYMNQAVPLAANSGYMFDILVDVGESIDFQTTVAATILKLSVVEKDDVK